MEEFFFLVVCTILHAHTKMYFSRVTILQRVNTMCNHSVKSWLWRWLRCCSFSCMLWADESISNRSGIVLASGTLCLITSNRATGHYSEDQMFLKKENVLFISIVSGYVCMYVCMSQTAYYHYVSLLSEYTVIPWYISYSSKGEYYMLNKVLFIPAQYFILTGVAI